MTILLAVNIKKMQHLNTSKREEDQNESKRNLAISIPPQQYEYEPLTKSNLISPALQENEKDNMGEINLLRESKSKMRKSRTLEVNAHNEVKDMTQVDRNKRTVLHRAAIDQNVDLIDELCDRAGMSPFMELEAFVNLRDASGNTALGCACVYNGDFGEEKRAECIKVLLDNRADPNLANQRTLWTPLTWCAHYGDDDGTKCLLEKGAYPFWPDHKGFYPLDHCGMQVCESYNMFIYKRIG
jgi:ankyrin repeat protein